jgi:hypothetical protein
MGFAVGHAHSAERVDRQTGRFLEFAVGAPRAVQVARGVVLVDAAFGRVGCENGIGRTDRDVGLRVEVLPAEDGEFADEFDDLDLPGVSIVKLTGRNNFAVKKLLSADDLTGDYLVYDPLAYEKDGRTTGCSTSNFSARNSVPTLCRCKWRSCLSNRHQQCGRR